MATLASMTTIRLVSIQQQRTIYLFLLLSILCTARSTLALENVTLVYTLPGVIGVWNSSLYPASFFRNESVKNYFKVWPESSTDLRFYYFCDDEKSELTLSNFTYSYSEGQLDPRPYYDLGTVDEYQPYWLHWTFWKMNTKVLVYPIHCEYTDIHRLYVHRFWRVVMIPAAKTAGVMLASLQVAVAISVTWKWVGTWSRKLGQSRDRSPRSAAMRVILADLKGWFWHLKWGDFFSDWIHIGLLVPVGFCMMEATGHSDLHKWRPVVTYNVGVIYSWLTFCSLLSSFLRQCAYGWLSPRESEEIERRSKQGDTWKSMKDISDDWRWQRVFGQLGVLILMGTYLSFVDDDLGAGMDNVASIMLAAVVVACIWSGGVTAVVGFRSTMHLLQQASTNKAVAADKVPKIDIYIDSVKCPYKLNMEAPPYHIPQRVSGEDLVAPDSKVSKVEIYIDDVPCSYVLQVPKH